MRRKLMAFSVLLLVILGWCEFAAAIPPTIHISGRLLDKDGNPVYYWKDDPDFKQVQVRVSLDAKIQFFDSATAATPFNIMVTTASAYNSYFQIPVHLPEAALVKDSLWYQLSIDADRNGLTRFDDFPDRFEIGSVPFAISARPLKYFTTFGGWKGGATQYHLYQNTLMVVPFETPAGGVEFNQMNIHVFELGANAAFSFGIYDEHGSMVTSSSLITSNVQISHAFLQIKHAVKKLQPSKIYYVGFARNSGMVMMLQGLKPVAPVLGTISTPYSDGRIPASFDPLKLDPNIEVLALPVTMCLVEGQGTPGGWLTKPGGTQYRWIPAKPAKPGAAAVEASVP